MRKTLILLAALCFLPAAAKEGTFLTGSYIHLGDSSSRLFTEDCPRPLDVTTSSYGFALGLGYQFHSGWTLSAQWLHARQDVEASGGRFGYDGTTSKDGFIVTGTIPLRWLSPACCK